MGAVPEPCVSNVGTNACMHGSGTGRAHECVHVSVGACMCVVSEKGFSEVMFELGLQA